MVLISHGFRLSSKKTKHKRLFKNGALVIVPVDQGGGKGNVISFNWKTGMYLIKLVGLKKYIQLTNPKDFALQRRGPAAIHY